MISGKIILIIFVALSLVIGLATLQDNSFYVNQDIDEEVSSDIRSIRVGISDGVGSVDNG